MDHDRLAAELVRALRGRRSQPALSRRLGYASNAVYGWESGRRAPSAHTFFRLAARSGVDIIEALRGFSVDTDPSALEQRAGLASWLRALGGDRSNSELARAVHADRTTVTRWLDGRTEPKLPELLRYVHATTQRLLEFLACFVDPASLASARAAYADLVAQRRLAYELPDSHAVLRALELDAYGALPRHEPGFIARRIGISLEAEAQCLKALVAAKQVKRVRGRYLIQHVLTVDTRPDEAQNRRLKQHWASVGLDRLRAGDASPDALFSYNLFPVSESDFERIRRLHIDYYERVREIVAESKRADRVVLVNVQLVPLQRA
jgi:transcriptional regulator with XRE-family HTH domain